jgi:hypothetical protein
MYSKYTWLNVGTTYSEFDNSTNLAQFQSPHKNVYGRPYSKTQHCYTH